MPHVMTRADRPGGPFRRRVAAGRTSKVLVFHPGKPIEVTPAQLKLLEPDLGVHLVEVTLDRRGRPRPIRQDQPPEKHSEKHSEKPPAETPPAS